MSRAENEGKPLSEPSPAAFNLSRQDIIAAAHHLNGRLIRTPFLYSATLSQITGARLWIKFENLQFTASFKERGALNRLLNLNEAQRQGGVIAVSAGNHAQAVARHAQIMNIAATIVMPRKTPFSKVSRTRIFGAEVILRGENLSEATVFAQDLAAQKGLTFVHPYDDPWVIAGQGATALEMLESEPDLDVIVAPIGGGGLAAGCVLAAQGSKTEILGVESTSFCAAAHALRQGPASSCSATIAEGIAVQQAGVLPLAIFRQYGLRILLVEEAMIERAVLLYAEIEKTIVEGAGASGLAAVLSHRERFLGRKVGLIASGGNIDARVLANVLMRGLARDGRLLRLRIDLEDRPGALAGLTEAIAHAGANVVEIEHIRWFGAGSANIAGVECLIEAEDAQHGRDVTAALNARGFCASART